MPATTFVNINCKKKPLRKTAKQKRPHALRHVSGRQTPRLNAKPTALQRKTDRPATPKGTYRNAKRRLSHTANSPEKAVSSCIPPPVCHTQRAKIRHLAASTHTQPATYAGAPHGGPICWQSQGPACACHSCGPCCKDLSTWFPIAAMPTNIQPPETCKEASGGCDIASCLRKSHPSELLLDYPLNHFGEVALLQAVDRGGNVVGSIAR